jgi:hypothetical protein
VRASLGTKNARMQFGSRFGGRRRGRALVFLTVFCSFVLLGSASAADAPDKTDTPAAAPAEQVQADPQAVDPPAVDPQAVDPQSQTEIQPSPTPSPDDDFGASTALSGNSAAIGSPGADDGAGKITIFHIGDDGTATQQASLSPPSSDQQGYGSSLSTDGATLAVGAPGNPDAESVDLYELGTAALLAQLNGQEDIGSDSGYGTAVAVSGDWLAVGAPGASNCDGECGYGEEGCEYCSPDGAVLIYHREDGVWVPSPYQVLYGPYSSAFGSSLALDGTTLVIGAPDETNYSGSDYYGVDAGAAHVYTLVEGESGEYWSEVGDPLTDPNPVDGEEFGSAVALDGTVIAAGAPNRANEGPGSVFLFDNLGEDGTPFQTIQGPSDSWEFGHTVALDGGNLAIGYVQPDNSGAVDLYTRQVTSPTPGFSFAGQPVRVSAGAGPFTYQGTTQGTGPADGYGQSVSASDGKFLIGGGGHAYVVGGHPSPGSGGTEGSSGSSGLPGSKAHLEPTQSGAKGGGQSSGSATAAAVQPTATVQVKPHISKSPPAEPSSHAKEEHVAKPAQGEGEGTPETDRSTFAQRVLSPTQLDFSFTNLAEGGIIAFLLAALLYLPVTIFNKATEKNHETISGWLAGPRRKLEAIAAAIPFGGHPLALLLSTGIVGGVLFSFVEPGFPGRAGSLQYLIGMILGFVLVASIFFGTWHAVVHRLEPQSEGRWRLYPPYIALAVMLVAVARLAHFLPGVVLGTLAEYEPGKRLSKRTAGLRVLVTYSMLLVFGFGAWFAWIPVEHAAQEPGASSLTLILDAALSIIFVTGLESAVFGLIPLRFLDGHDLFTWHKGLWLGLWGIGVYWFAVVILHPALTTYNEVSSAGVFWFGILFGSLMLAALSTWAFFAVRDARLRARAESTSAP